MSNEENNNRIENNVGIANKILSDNNTNIIKPEGKPIYCGDFNMQDFIIPKPQDDDLKKRLEEHLEVTLKDNEYHIDLTKLGAVKTDYMQKFLTGLINLEYDQISKDMFDITIERSIENLRIEIPRFSIYDIFSKDTREISLSYNPPKRKKSGVEQLFTDTTYDFGIISTYNNFQNSLKMDKTKMRAYYNNVLLEDKYFIANSKIDSKDAKEIKKIFGDEKKNFEIYTTSNIILNGQGNIIIDKARKYFNKDQIYIACDNKPEKFSDSESAYTKNINHNIQTQNVLIIGQNNNNISLLGTFNPQMDDEELLAEMISKGVI